MEVRLYGNSIPHHEQRYTSKMSSRKYCSARVLQRHLHRTAMETLLLMLCSLLLCGLHKKLHQIAMETISRDSLNLKKPLSAIDNKHTRRLGHLHRQDRYRLHAQFCLICYLCTLAWTNQLEPSPPPLPLGSARAERTCIFRHGSTVVMVLPSGLLQCSRGSYMNQNNVAKLGASVTM